MAGIFESFLRGGQAARQERDDQTNREYLASERNYQQQRRGVLDTREDTTYGQTQEDRTRNLAEHGEDRAYTIGVQRPAETERLLRDNRKGAFEEARAPIKAKQEDQKFAFQMDKEKREARLDGLRMELAQYGLDDKRREEQRRVAMDSLKPAIAAYSRTRDPRVFAEWANRTVAQTDPIQIEQDDKGNWFMQSKSGNRQDLGSADNVVQVAMQLTHPDVFLEFQASQLARQRELQDKRLAAEATADAKANPELVNDGSGAIHIVDTRTGMSRPVMRDEGNAPLVGTKAGAFGSRTGDRSVGVRRGDEKPQPVFQVSENGNGPLPPVNRAPLTDTRTATPASAPASAAPPEGTRLKSRDGRIYVVRNGQPVPEQ